MEKWWPELSGYSYAGDKVPTNNEELSEYLDAFHKKGHPLGLRYMGKMVWIGENCIEDNDDAYSNAYGLAKYQTLDQARDRSPPDFLDKKEKQRWETGYIHGLHDRLPDDFDFSVQKKLSLKKGMKKAEQKGCPQLY